MAITADSRDGVHLLRLTGDFTVGRHFTKPMDLQGRPLVDLRETIEDLLQRGQPRIVLDLERLKFIDSSGLGELVACKRRAVECGGNIKILHPAGKVQEVLVLTLLTEVFEVFHDEVAAVRSFQRA